MQHAPRHTVRVSTAWPPQARGWAGLLHVLAIGGPIGFIPWVPATWASLVTAAAVFWWQPSLGPLLLAVVGVSFLGVAAAGAAERLERVRDPRNVVLDEVAGQLLTFLGLAHPLHWPRCLLGFLLFRLFDVLKPFPARRLETLPAGWGVMADDLAAGCYALLALWVVAFWLH